MGAAYLEQRYLPSGGTVALSATVSSQDRIRTHAQPATRRYSWMSPLARSVRETCEGPAFLSSLGATAFARGGS